MAVSGRVEIVCECGQKLFAEGPGRSRCPTCRRPIRVDRRLFAAVASGGIMPKREMPDKRRGGMPPPIPEITRTPLITGKIPWSHMDAVMLEALGQAEMAVPRDGHPKAGPGDLVARFTSALGIKPCRSCRRRRDSLNQLGWRIVAGSLAVTVLAGIVLGVVGTLAVMVW